MTKQLPIVQEEQTLVEPGEKFGGKTLTSWHSFINTGFKKTVETTLDSASRISTYKDAVPADVFKKTMKEWYGFSEAQLSYWAKIAENTDMFKEHINILPASPRSLYELGTLDKDVFQELIDTGKIKPSLTVEGIKELKAEGGKLKAFLLRFAQSPDYLEVCRMSDFYRRDTTLTTDEVIFKLASWIKEEGIEVPSKVKPKIAAKPAVANDSDDFDDDDDDRPSPWGNLNAQGEVWPQPKAKESEVILAMSRENAYAVFGVYFNKPLDNMAVERALTAQAGDDEKLLKALEVIIS
jgi:hypothetical protein